MKITRKIGSEVVEKFDKVYEDALIKFEEIYPDPFKENVNIVFSKRKTKSLIGHFFPEERTLYIYDFYKYDDELTQGENLKESQDEHCLALIHELTHAQQLDDETIDDEDLILCEPICDAVSSVCSRVEMTIRNISATVVYRKRRSAKLPYSRYSYLKVVNEHIEKIKTKLENKQRDC